MENYFQWERFTKAVPQILEYLDIAFEFLIVCTIFSMIFAVIVAVLRIKKIPVVDQLLAVFVSYMRGTPFLVQMMVVYYGLPLLLQATLRININSWEPLIFAEIALILNEAAFFGEIIRGALLSIPPIQIEAAYSIGMTRSRTFFRIVLPQLIRILVPSIGSMIAEIFQDSSLLYLVGIMDMMSRANSINAATGHALEAYLVVAVVYIVFNLVIKGAFGFMESRMNYGRR